MPTAKDLPDSVETPVDNELQNHIPNLLLNLLMWIWRDRQDWFFGVDMCYYFDPNIKEPNKSKYIVPEKKIDEASKELGSGEFLDHIA